MCVTPSVKPKQAGVLAENVRRWRLSPGWSTQPEVWASSFPRLFRRPLPIKNRGNRNAPDCAMAYILVC